MIALKSVISNQDVIFCFLTISFLLMGLLKAFYWKYTKLFFLGVFAQRYSNQYLREDNAFTERVSAITFLIMVINFSLLLLKFSRGTSWTFFFYLTGSFCLFFFCKSITIRFLGKIFMIEDVSKLAVFFSFLFDKVLAFLLFPLILVMYFFVFDINTILYILMIILCVFLLLLKLFWTWKIGTKNFGFSRFYIFLYLCILEISPVLILAKVILY